MFWSNSEESIFLASLSLHNNKLFSKCAETNFKPLQTMPSTSMARQISALAGLLMREGLDEHNKGHPNRLQLWHLAHLISHQGTFLATSVCKYEIRDVRSCYCRISTYRLDFFTQDRTRQVILVKDDLGCTQAISSAQGFH